MKLINKKILIISPESWDHIFVSKHHYATHLGAKGNHVYFLNPPSDTLDCKLTEYHNVFSVNYNGFIKGIRFMPAFLQQYFIRVKFEALQKICGIKFDIVWTFDNSVFFDLSALPKSVFCISHIVDWNQNFKFIKATKTADLCLASSRYIVDRQKIYNHNSHNIGHGFNKIEGKLKQIELQGFNKINCGYAGNLDIQYIDWNLVEKLLNNFPEVDFHFAGNWKSVDSFSYIIEKPNFHYYGKLPSSSLPDFYNSNDILILVYTYEKYPEQLANPHKMMEYLSSGKMVLATWTEEYFNLSKDGIIKMAKSLDEYILLFNEVKNNLGYWNNNEIMNFRKDFAIKNTYENQIEKIEGLIS